MIPTPLRASVCPLLILAAVLSPGNGGAQRRSPVTIQTTIDRPERLPFSPSTAGQLRAPVGFNVSVFASGLGAPRMMALGPDGVVFVTRGDSGDVVALRDTDGDGRADVQRTVLAGLPGVHGITIANGRMYVATTTSVYATETNVSDRPANARVLLEGLPNGGQHSRRTIAFGPDGNLYISVGSTCNDCPEVNPENATILRASPDGRQRTVFARGLRNTIGWGWHPRTGEMWGWDHGSDFRGDNIPPEELNRIVQGGNYGWPFCYGSRVVDRYSHYDPPASSPAAYCASTEPSAATYLAHSAPIGMVFYTGQQFPGEYQTDAFVAMHGSWNRSPAAPAKVLRIRFQSGRPMQIEDFLTGFLVNGNRSLIGRPAGLLVAADGSLLVSDDANGAIYRISYGLPAPTPSTGNAAVQVAMQDAAGRDLGMLTLTDTDDGIRLAGTLRNLPPGRHGIHLHMTGLCEAPAFTTAGGHWNPVNRQHGIENPDGAHAGDMLNITVARNGQATVRVTTQGGTLRGGPAGPVRLGRGRARIANNIGVMDADGAAVVIHADPDDYRTDPSGNSGARIACGVIR